MDKYIVGQAPWKLAAKPEAAAALDATLYTAAEVVRVAAVLLAPVIPDSAAKIWAQLGMPEPLESVRIDRLAWGQLAGGQKIGEIAAVFPRIDAKVAIAQDAGTRSARDRPASRAARQDARAARPVRPRPPPRPSPSTTSPRSICALAWCSKPQAVKGADKLLQMKVDIGEAEPRSIVAGIAEAYKPEDLVGRKVVIVANLEHRKLRGIPSQGMIVAASVEGGKPVLAGFLEDVPVGARLK